MMSNKCFIYDVFFLGEGNYFHMPPYTDPRVSGGWMARRGTLLKNYGNYNL